MPSSKIVTVERLTDGMRQTQAEFMVPYDLELSVLEAEDHVHLVYGLPDELVAHGLKSVEPVEVAQADPVDEPVEVKKPKRKAPAKKKAAAKPKKSATKPAAQKRKAKA